MPTAGGARHTEPRSKGGAGGDAGGGEGQFFLSHLLNFFLAASNLFVHFVHFFLPASTLVARSSEMRRRIMSFIVCALCVPARAKATAHDRMRARGRRGCKWD